VSRVVFDTNIFISYSLTDDDLSGSAIAMPVLFELTATTISKSERQFLERIKIAADKDDRLLTPTMSDWWEAAKVVSRVRFGEKSASHGKTPPAPNAQRLAFDSIIARVVYVAKYVLVTRNVKDFERIQPFCGVTIISSKDYFGYDPDDKT
jgi:predicted nucleic acid-binding protein